VAETHGRAAPGFERVREVFAETIRADGAVGAALSVYLRGDEVVQLWGGERDRDLPWRVDTLVCGFSTGKGIATLAIQILVDRGLLDLDAPVFETWPEFAAGGKEAVTTRMLLNHTAGLPTFPAYERIVDTDRPASFQRHGPIAAGLAAAEPLWEPGTQSGYHSLTMGFLLAEVVLRLTGVTIGEFIRREVVAPLGLDYWVGLPRTEHYRVARLCADPAFDDDLTYASMNPATLAGQAFFLGEERRLGTVFEQTFNDPEFRVAEVAAAGPHTDARSLARIYGALAQGGTLDGVTLVSPASIREFARQSLEGTDCIANIHSRLGLGYALNSPRRYAMGPNPGTFGHPGYGGATAFADPEAGIGFGFVSNALIADPGTDPRVQELIRALYGCLRPDARRGRVPRNAP
jgi:CubicO group peptidase (beta-lactamase class C family)